MAEVYILHFDKPYWGKAQHYVGYTKFTTSIRVAVHRGELKNGSKPSKLVQYALRHGIDFKVVHTEQFDEPWQARQREKQIKKWHNTSALCPICREKRRTGKT